MRMDRIPPALYNRALAECAFTDDELDVLAMRRKNASLVSISMKLNMSEATVSRRIKSNKDKMADL